MVGELVTVRGAPAGGSEGHIVARRRHGAAQRTWAGRRCWEPSHLAARFPKTEHALVTSMEVDALRLAPNQRKPLIIENRRKHGRCLF